MIIQILKPELLFPALNETRYDKSFNNTIFELPLQAQSDLESAVISAIAAIANVSLKIFFVGNMALSVFLSVVI